MPHHAIDHLVYATPDLNATVNALEAQLGVRPSVGGQHPVLGTRNALLSLGPRMYLEIVGPDPQQPSPDGPRWFRIDTLTEPTLVTWCAAATELESLRARAAGWRAPRLAGDESVCGSGARARALLH